MNTLRVGWMFLKVGVMNELQYRANFFVAAFQSLLTVGVGLIVLALVYSHTTELNGWTQSELLVILGVQILLGGVVHTSFQPNMQRLVDEVQDGKLDFALTKPEDAQALISLRDVQIWQAVDVISGSVIVVVGAAGSAITADLGARKVREELDALQVLGVDPVKNLVVPRFLALMVATGLFDIYAVLFGIFGGITAALAFHQPLGPFWNTLFADASTVDLWGSVLKCTMFGAIIAIVCCYKGMSASGGAEGVGRAVNEAVVVAFLGIGAFNYVFTQTLLATHPNILVIR